MPYNVLGAGSASGYEIEQSLRFEDGDSAVLSLTPSTSNRKTFTWSGWIKRGNIPASYMNLFGATDGVNNEFDIRITNSNTLEVGDYTSPSYNFDVITSQVFRDVSSWYHIVVVINTTESTASDRVKIYINGSQVTSFSTASYPSLNYDTYINNSSYPTYIASFSTTANRFDGYLAEVNFIDGQALTPSDFGKTDLLTNQWIPKKYVGTYGTNGFYLNFSNSASLGADSSGNGNNFTPTNLAATDQVLDSPTNNFATLQPTMQILESSGTYSEGNLSILKAGNSNVQHDSSIRFNSGKWYWEVLVNQMASPTSNYYYIGTQNHVWASNGDYYDQGTPGWVAQGVTFTQGDLISVALDYEGQTIKFYKNGSLTLDKTLYPSVIDYFSARGRINGNGGTAENIYNFGQDSSFAGNKTAQNNTDDNGVGDFYYAPPSGYLALCENNLPDPSIALPGDHFNTVLYTGNGSTQSITGVGFQPNLNWIKARNSPEYHVLHDVLRGANNRLFSNTTDAETTAPTMTSFDSDGFSVSTDGGTYSATNANGTTYAAWNWKANGSGVTNTDGSTTSTVSANTTAGFSIVTCTTLAGTQTVGHGLSQAPDIVIQKSRNTAQSWYVYYDFVDGSQDYLTLNSTAAAAAWGGSAATSTVFYENWSAGVNLICYCFHSVEGYSKFGSYTGNGSADGPFVYTGFRPAFVMVKRADGAQNWPIVDTGRDTYNIANKRLFPNLSSAEDTGIPNYLDLLSNGFKCRDGNVSYNASGGTYIYMAFAESPFKYSNAR